MKSRYWTFLTYPDSVEENWINILEETGLQFAVSPIHDRDIEKCLTPEDFEKPNLIEILGDKYYYKKPHYHVLVMYEGPKTYKSFKEEVCDKVKGTIPKKVESIRGMYAYLTHKNNPEKAQYESKDIKEYNEFKLELTTTEITLIKQKICIKIIEENIKEYSDLLDYYLEIGDNDYWEVASNHTYFFDRYITSKRHKEIEENKKEYKNTLVKKK